MSIFSRVSGYWFTDNKEDTQRQQDPDVAPSARPDNSGSVVEVTDPRLGDKRLREGDGGQSQEHAREQKKVKVKDKTRNSDHLLPNYKVPPHARPLGTPSSYSFKRDWNPSPPASKPPTQQTTTKMPRGGFQPRNTLSQQSRQAPSNSSGPAHVKQSAAGQNGKASAAQPANGPQGSHTERKRYLLEDDEIVDRRVGRVATKILGDMPSSQHIDLTSSVSPEPRAQEHQPKIVFGTTVSRASEQASERSQGSGVSKRQKFQQHSPSWFTSNEQRNADQYVRAGSEKHDKKTRKSLHHQNRDATPRHTNKTNGNRRSVIDVGRDLPKPAWRPVINLDEGMEDAADHHQQERAQRYDLPKPNHFAADTPVEGVKDSRPNQSSVVESQRGNPWKLRDTSREGVDQVDFRRAQVAVQRHPPAIIQKPRSSNFTSGMPTRTSENSVKTQSSAYGVQHASDTKAENVRAEEVQSSLRLKFRRDDDGLDSNAYLDNRHTRQDRLPSGTMQEGSEDELHGESNLLSRQTRHTSPRETEPQTSSPTQPSPALRENKVAGQSRPSEHIGVAASERDDESRQGVRTSDEEDLGLSLVPIRAIFSQAFTANDEGLALNWDQNKEMFVVMAGREPVRIPGTDELITIGEPDVRHRWQENRVVLKVCLSGSKTTYTTGKILLEFLTVEDLSDFFHALCDVVGRPETLSPMEMDKLFEHQKAGLLQSNAKFQKTSRLQLSQTQHPVSQQRGVQPSAHQRTLNRLKNGSERLRSAAAVEDSLNNDLTEADHQQPRSRSQNQSEETSKYFGQEPERRSTRSAKKLSLIKERTPPLKWTEIHGIPRWSRDYVYPGDAPRGVVINGNDIERLDEGQCLNDNIVNYELRYVEEHMAKENRPKVHFFNTFFYSALSTKNGRKSKDANYDTVKRWTKNIDLFTIPYIVVPVNVSFHWFAAIICNLQAFRRRFSDDGTSSKENGDANATANPVEWDNDLDVSIDEGEGRPSSVARSDVFAFEGDRVASNLDEDPELREKSGPRRKTRKSKLPKYDTDEPIIVALDSLGNAHSAELKYLKQYVSIEAREKRAMTIDPQDLKGMTAKGLPEQSNMVDCGVYLLGYIQEFANDPDLFIRKVLQREMDAKSDFAAFNPSDKRNGLRERLLRDHAEQEASYKAQKKARKEAKKGQTTETAEQKTVNSAAPEIPPTLPPPNTAPLPLKPERHAMPNMEISSPLQKSSERAAFKKSVDEEEDDEGLEIKPPRPQGQEWTDQMDVDAQISQPPAKAPADGVDEDEEMLDVAEADRAPGSSLYLNGAEEPCSKKGRGDSYTEDDPNEDAESPTGLTVKTAVAQRPIGDLHNESNEEIIWEVPDSQEQAQRLPSHTKSPD